MSGVQTFAHFMIALAGVGLAAYPNLSSQQVMKDDLGECLADAAKSAANASKKANAAGSAAATPKNAAAASAASAAPAKKPSAGGSGSGSGSKKKKESYTEYYTKEELCYQKYPVASGFFGFMKLWGGFLVITVGFLFLYLVQRGTFASWFTPSQGQYSQQYQQQYQDPYYQQ